MNPISINGNLDFIGPIIMFVFWIIIMQLSNAKKKKMRQQQQQNRQATPVPGTNRTETTRPQQQQTGKPRISDDIRDTLENVFKEMGLPLPQEEEPDQPESRPVEQPIEPAYREQAAPDKEDRSQKKNTPVYGKYSSPRETVSGEIGSTLEQEQVEYISIDAESSRELRKGILWAEIIGPPIAMREPRQV